MANQGLTPEIILSMLRQQKSLLREKFYVQEIGLFGSYARNEANDQSDIDFIVTFEEGNLDYYTIRCDLGDFHGSKFKKEVDIAIRKSVKSFYRDIIFNQAIYA